MALPLIPALPCPPLAAHLPTSPTLQVVVVVNKVDRPAARCDYVINQTFELFMDLGASDEQCGEQRIARTRAGCLLVPLPARCCRPPPPA